MDYQLALKIIFNTIEDLRINNKAIADKAGISAVYLSKMKKDIGKKDSDKGTGAGFDIVCKLFKALNLDLSVIPLYSVAEETVKMYGGDKVKK